MQESLLQFIWEHGYFNKHELATCEGDALEILCPGIRNTHQGPDFIQARIRIGKTEWVGNVELHSYTGDWHRHGHGEDPRYRNLVLHVVWRHHGEAPGRIPILELEGRVPVSLIKTYTAWMNNPSALPCAGMLGNSITELMPAWRDTLVNQRLASRTVAWLEELERLHGHWEELCWRKVARNFGYSVNADAFEELARALPLKLIAKHKTQIHQLESLLLGQSGLLWGNWDDPYPKLLQKEYEYLRKLHQLKPILGKMQFLRMRPGNFPTVRLAQLAMLINQSSHLFRSMLTADSVSDLSSLFEVTANDFWHYHYRFGKASAYLPKTVGIGMIRNIIINTAVPLIYVYGQWKGDPAHVQKAVRFLHELPPETDHAIGQFIQAGLRPAHAADSQAMHMLKRSYCDLRRCLDCAIGRKILGEN